MLKKIRQTLAAVVFALICLLFVDVSGFFQPRLAFLAKLQLVPAILSGSLVTGALLMLTLFFGRIYCSVLCPLGILQDGIARLGKKRRSPYNAYSKGKTRLRVALLILFAAAFFAGLPLVFGLLEPYSAFGRIAVTILAPFWQLGGNALAEVSAYYENFIIAPTPIWIRGWASFIVGLTTLAVIGVLASKGGRTWCNTLCPVGTVLGFLNRFALFRPRVHGGACTHCGACARACKASCIDAEKGVIDASRCVSCFNCLDACRKNAIVYTSSVRFHRSATPDTAPDLDRRAMLGLAVGAMTATAWPIMKTVDALAAGKAEAEEIPALSRKTPHNRDVPVLPPGAGSLQQFGALCTGCQLCVAACPNSALRSFDHGFGMLQPALSFERGYCRPNCVACSEVCPTNAIDGITVAEKSAIQIGRAKVDLDICILTTGKECTTCSRNCPASAITCVTTSSGVKAPAVNHETCTGCGACEYFCPTRPQAAIRVKGNHAQRKI